MKISLALATALILSNCTYHTYVAPKPTVSRSSSSSTKSGGKVHSSTNADSFQAVTKPSTYSR